MDAWSGVILAMKQGKGESKTLMYIVATNDLKPKP